MKKQRKQLGGVSIIVLGILLLLAIAVAFTISGLNRKLVYHHVIEWDAKVADYVGFNLDEDKLHFGAVNSGGRASRSVDINISGEGYLLITNEDNQWVFSTKENPYYVDGGSIELFLVANPSNKIEPGLYESTLHVYVLKEEPSWLEMLFLKGTPLKTFDESLKSAGAKIKVVNPNSTVNSSSQE